MRIAKAVVAVVALLGVGPTSAIAQEVVTVERRTSTAAIVLRDTVAGALVGSAVAGGIILYEMEIQDNEDYDWGETLAWGALIGLGAGLVFGLVDATSGPTYANVTKSPVRDGLSLSLDVRRRDQSGREMFPVVAGRF